MARKALSKLKLSPKQLQDAEAALQSKDSSTGCGSHSLTRSTCVRHATKAASVPHSTLMISAPRSSTSTVLVDSLFGLKERAAGQHMRVHQAPMGCQHNRPLQHHQHATTAFKVRFEGMCSLPVLLLPCFQPGLLARHQVHTHQLTHARWRRCNCLSRWSTINPSMSYVFLTRYLADRYAQEGNLLG
jgi:hypothetical protein